MGFLKKIFGEASGNPPEASPPPPEVVPRAPRVRPHPLDSLAFVRTDGVRVGVANISTSGVGLLNSAQDAGAPRTTRLEGVFDFGGRPVPARLRAVRHSSDVTGYVFEGEPETLRRLIREYFEIQISAMELVKVDPSTLKPDPGGAVHWYRGRNNCDLYFVTSGARILRFTLSFFGHYLEGEAGKAVKLGRVDEDDTDRVGVKGSDIVRWQSAATGDLLAGARKFIAHVASLSPSERDALIEMLGT